MENKLTISVICATNFYKMQLLTFSGKRRKII